MQAYKFRGESQFPYILDIILNQRLRCSDWKTLNDPMEGRFAYTFDEVRGKDCLEKMDHIIREKCQIKICSLSRTFDSLLLWAHYAEGFTGVAIEIDLPDNNNSIKPVTYERGFAKITQDDFNIRNPDELADMVLLHKNHVWRYENETRIRQREEWFNLENSIKSVIVGHRIKPVLLQTLKIVCEKKCIPIRRIVIDENGIEANDYPFK